MRRHPVVNEITWGRDADFQGGRGEESLAVRLRAGLHAAVGNANLRDAASLGYAERCPAIRTDP